MKRGDVVICEFPYVDGRRGKNRPALIIQNDQDNQRLTNTIVAMISGNSVAVYANQIAGSKFPLFKVSIKKNIFEKDKFKSVSSLLRDDLPVASYLLEQAWLKIMDLEQEARKESKQGDSNEEGSEDESPDE